MDHELLSRLLTLRVPSERAICGRLAAGYCYSIPTLNRVTLLVYLRHVTVTGPERSEMMPEETVQQMQTALVLGEMGEHYDVEPDGVRYVEEARGFHDMDVDEDWTTVSLSLRSKRLAAVVLTTRARMRKELRLSE